MTAREQVRGPLRVPTWPSTAAEEPDFAAIRAEFDVPEEFPPQVLVEADRRSREPVLPELDATVGACSTRPVVGLIGRNGE